LSIEPEKIGKRTDRASGTPDPEKMRGGHTFRRYRRTVFLLIIGSALMLGIYSLAKGHGAALHYTAFAQASANSAAVKSVAVFTPARASFLDAVEEYIGWQPTPVQPIAFNHKIHLQNNVECTSCHEGVTQGPNAGIPSVSFCMA
jgi:hypothetical protein